jgi:hypothetical protein
MCWSALRRLRVISLLASNFDFGGDRKLEIRKQEKAVICLETLVSAQNGVTPFTSAAAPKTSAAHDSNETCSNKIRKQRYS